MSKYLLTSGGWHLPTDKEVERFIDNNDSMKRTIIIISHTSVWDFFLLMLYRQADPRIGKNLYLVVKPQLIESYGSYLESVGCISATRSEENGGGFIEQTTKRFTNDLNERTNSHHDKYKEFKIIISPEGKLVASPWRSGYYYLAQNLEASIMVAGLDYADKKLYIGKIHSYDEIQSMDKDELEEQLKEEMSRIVPLHPEGSSIPITKKYSSKHLTPINWLPWILIIVLIILLIVLIIYLIYRWWCDKYY